MYRLFCVGLFALSLIWLAEAATSEIRGSVTVYNPGSGIGHFYTKDKSPNLFRHAMTYLWIRSLLPGFAGYILFRLIRKQESLDPFSPNFKGKDSIEELEKVLNQKEKDEK